MYYLIQKRDTKYPNSPHPEKRADETKAYYHRNHCGMVDTDFFIGAKLYDCFILRFISLPRELTDDMGSEDGAVVLLYGKNLCGTCPAGKFMYRISGNRNIIYLVPDDYSSHEIENLRYTFDMSGKIVHSGREMENLLKRIKRCKKVKNSGANYYLLPRNGNKINTIEVF